MAHLLGSPKYLVIWKFQLDNLPNFSAHPTILPGKIMGCNNICSGNLGVISLLYKISSDL
jgi:hypothetical protein